MQTKDPALLTEPDVNSHLQGLGPSVCHTRIPHLHGVQQGRKILQKLGKKTKQKYYRWSIEKNKKITNHVLYIRHEEMGENNWGIDVFRFVEEKAIEPIEK